MPRSTDDSSEPVDELMITQRYRLNRDKVVRPIGDDIFPVGVWACVALGNVLSWNG